MNTERIFWGCVMLAALGIIVFWVAGFNEMMTISLVALILSGILCWVAIGAKILHYVQNRHLN